MGYLELALAVRPDPSAPLEAGAVELVADLLRRYAPTGVSIEPPYRPLDDEGGVARDPDAPVRLRAWLPDDGDEARAAVAALRRDLRALGDSMARPLRVRAVADRAWAEAWKRHFPVLRIGRRLVVRPSWRRHRARADEVVIELDPGMTFGTGQHPTTRLCLEALEGLLVPGARVLDVGTGSGVLAVAAALLGAAGVDAIDIEPAAVRAARENAARNGVGRVVRVAHGSLGEAWPFPEPPVGRYELVLANLSSRLVRELAAPLLEALAPQGRLLVSGIIEEHEAACGAALETAGGAIIERRLVEGWRLLVVRAAAAHS